jgi:hypothetical protein
MTSVDGSGGWHYGGSETVTPLLQASCCYARHSVWRCAQLARPPVNTHVATKPLTEHAHPRSHQSPQVDAWHGAGRTIGNTGRQRRVYRCPRIADLDYAPPSVAGSSDPDVRFLYNTGESLRSSIGTAGRRVSRAGAPPALPRRSSLTFASLGGTTADPMPALTGHRRYR